jgi:hypothetical protein
VQYLIVAVCALIYDCVAGLHTVALAKGRVALAVWTGILLPPLGWVSLLFLIEAKTRWEQALILGCNSAAIAVGVWVTVKSTAGNGAPSPDLPRGR